MPQSLHACKFYIEAKGINCISSLKVIHIGMLFPQYNGSALPNKQYNLQSMG